jgi:acetate kinase
MGFTPLEGLMMGSRSGSVDPGLLLHLLANRGVDIAALDSGLNEQAGLLGVSGVSGDLRKIQTAADSGNARAKLAIDIFVHRLATTIGGLAATLGGLDGLVFTGGIGEHSPTIRAGVAAKLTHLGVTLDKAANERASGDADLSVERSTARVLVVAAREDLSVLAAVKQVLGDV